jgi:hypothetical protein
LLFMFTVHCESPSHNILKHYKESG